MRHAAPLPAEGAPGSRWRVPEFVIPGFLVLLRRLNCSVQIKMAIFCASQLSIPAPIADGESKMTREKVGVEGSLLLLTVSS